MRTYWAAAAAVVWIWLQDEVAVDVIVDAHTGAVRAEDVAHVATGRPAVLAEADVAKVLVACRAAVGLGRNVVASVTVEMADSLLASRVGARVRGELDEQL